MKYLSLFSCVVLVLLMSACSLLSGVSTDITEQGDKATFTTTLSDSWTKRIVIEGTCYTKSSQKGSNGVTDTTYSDCR